MFELGTLDANVNGLRLSSLQLGFSVQHVTPRSDATIVPVGGEIEGFLKRDRRFVKQSFFRVECTELKIRLCQLCLRTQLRRRQIRCARLRVGFAGFHGSPNPAPDIDFPSHIERQRVFGELRRRLRWSRAYGRRTLLAGNTNSKSDGGIISGPGGHNQSACLAIACFGLREVWFDRSTCSSNPLSSGSANISHHLGFMTSSVASESHSAASDPCRDKPPAWCKASAFG